MEREIARVLPYILLGMFLLGVLTLLVALYQLRVRRTGSYWLLRRRAGERGGRLFLIAVGLIIASLTLTVVTGLAAVAFKNVNTLIHRSTDDLYGIVLPPDSALATTQVAQSVLTETRPPVTATLPATEPTAALPATLPPPTEAAATLAPTATITPIPPSPVPPTETPLATTTPSPTPTSLVLLELTSAFNMTPRPPTANYSLSLTAADTIVNPNGTPLSPRRTFDLGVKRLYFFIAFSTMENGVAWSRVLYRDGDPVQGNTFLWSLGADGNSYFFFGDEAGYAPGDYEVRLFVGDKEASRLHFEVKND